MTIYAYTRVSTDDQGRSGLGLEAQEAAITAWAGGRPFELVTEIGSGGKNLPALTQCVNGMGAGDILAVAKLDRLARSTQRVLSILEALERRSAGFVALDLGIDTTTPAGRLLLTMMAALAEWERGVISERTTAAMQAAIVRDPDHFKRPERATTTDVKRKARRMRDQGMTLRAIAESLTASGIPTPQSGKPWTHGSVAYLLNQHKEMQK